MKKISEMNSYEFADYREVNFPSINHFYTECGRGWFKLLIPIFEYINKYNESRLINFEKIQVLQIKEKFGTLRFYTSFITDELDSLIRIAMKKSKNTCEICGKRGKLVELNGWWSARCKGCR